VHSDGFNKFLRAALKIDTPQSIYISANDWSLIPGDVEQTSLLRNFGGQRRICLQDSLDAGFIAIAAADGGNTEYKHDPA
jgi:hypothetical protein